jgi:putative DNA primase/helicase
MSQATTDTDAATGNAATNGPARGGFKRSNTASPGEGNSKSGGGNSAAKTDFPPVSRRPVFCCYDHAFVVDGKHYKAGVYYHHLAPVKDDNGKIVGKEPEELWICSVLKVDSIVRTTDGNEHSYLLHYVPHGQSALHTTVLSQSLLLSRPEDAFRELRSIGVSVLAQNVKLVRRYLDEQHLRFGTHTPESFAELAKVIGWHGSKTFVLPGKIIGDEKHSRVWFSDTSEAANYSSGGTSEGWKTNVAGLAPGNDYLVFGISFGFAGPLLEHLNLPGVAAHLYGDSTGGKTSIQFAAGSVWGPRGFTSTSHGYGE